MNVLKVKYNSLKIQVVNNETEKHKRSYTDYTLHDCIRFCSSSRIFFPEHPFIYLDDMAGGWHCTCSANPESVQAVVLLYSGVFHDRCGGEYVSRTYSPFSKHWLYVSEYP